MSNVFERIIIKQVLQVLFYFLGFLGSIICLKGGIFNARFLKVEDPILGS